MSFQQYSKVAPRSAFVKGFSDSSVNDFANLSSTSLWTISSSGALMLNPLRFSNTSVYLPTLFVDNLTVNINFVWVSDEREKKNIQPIEETEIDKLLLLNPIQFEFDKNKSSSLSSSSTLPSSSSSSSNIFYGFSAQEVASLYPHLVKVKNNESQTLSINYLGFIPLLVKKIQDLENKISFLNNS